MAGLLAMGGLVAFGGHPVKDPVSPAQVARMSAALAAARSSEAAVEVATRRVLVVGDSYTAGSAQGGVGPAGWAILVQRALSSPSHPVYVNEAADGGSGYVNPGPRHVTFPELIMNASGSYNLIVFFGSRNDDAPGVQAAAAAAFATARTKFPHARLLVIGPPWVNGNPPGFVTDDRDAVAAAARAAGATFVDPLAARWFVGHPELIGADGIHPTDAGHRYMAGLIRPAIEAALAAT